MKGSKNIFCSQSYWDSGFGHLYIAVGYEFFFKKILLIAAGMQRAKVRPFELESRMNESRMNIILSVGYYILYRR